MSEFEYTILLRLSGPFLSTVFVSADINETLIVDADAVRSDNEGIVYAEW